MFLTWSGPEGSSHTNLCLCAPFLYMQNEVLMKEALKEAAKAFKEDEVPVGCVIVKDSIVISKAHNKKESKGSSIFHAEIEAIRKACKKLGTWHLDDCEMYVTLEPCMMCMGAIINSRIKKIYYATADPKGGAAKSIFDIKNIKGLNHYPECEAGLMHEEASNLLKNFFKNKR